MLKIPSLSSKDFVKLLKDIGCEFVRQGSTDHAIYSRIVEGKRYSSPIQMGKKSLNPVYIKMVLKQLKFTNKEIENIFSKNK